MADIAYLQDLAAQKSLEWQEHVAKVANNFKTVWALVHDIVAEAVKFGQSLGLIGENFGKFTKPGDAPARSGTAGAVTAAAEPLPEGATPMVVRIGARKPRPAAKPADTTKPIITSRNTGRSSDTEEPDAVEQYIRQLNKARDVAQAEYEAVGKTVTERERLLALARAEAAARDDFERGRRDSPKLDDDERARTIAAANRLGDLKARTLDLEQAQRQAADTARYFGQMLADGMADAALEGRSLNDVLNNVMKSIARASLSAVLTGQGPLAGLFGTAPAASAGPNAVGGLTGLLSGAFRGAGSDPLQGPTLSGPRSMPRRAVAESWASWVVSSAPMAARSGPGCPTTSARWAGRCSSPTRTAASSRSTAGRAAAGVRGAPPTSAATRSASPRPAASPSSRWRRSSPPATSACNATCR